MGLCTGLDWLRAVLHIAAHPGVEGRPELERPSGCAMMGGVGGRYQDTTGPPLHEPGPGRVSQGQPSPGRI
ncbi:hypothetical protein BGZ61DRAFT_438700 [Ilyonectria robusta]|uniref:uncharacterized protein n=1 Tax=Ilyonectria robusta TaxID=1079257 RepID=UPI001E8E2EAA|nr:uncharacterized protein BGZ61DRAFT_438700 [Ilyonectria robusta]KAH8737632.1 hypothetical protein BGZ61DRAFT_438700 [Ilyonectria robusta]